MPTPATAPWITDAIDRYQAKNRALRSLAQRARRPLARIRAVQGIADPAHAWMPPVWSTDLRRATTQRVLRATLASTLALLIIALLTPHPALTWAALLGSGVCALATLAAAVWHERTLMLSALADHLWYDNARFHEYPEATRLGLHRALPESWTAVPAHLRRAVLVDVNHFLATARPTRGEVMALMRAAAERLDAIRQDQAHRALTLHREDTASPSAEPDLARVDSLLETLGEDPTPPTPPAGDRPDGAA